MLQQSSLDDSVFTVYREAKSKGFDRQQRKDIMYEYAIGIIVKDECYAASKARLYMRQHEKEVFREA